MKVLAAVFFCYVVIIPDRKKIQDPKYLKCGQNVTILSATEIGSVTLRLMYYISSSLFLFSIDSLSPTDMTSLSPIVLDTMLFCPKYLGGGKRHIRFWML